MKQVKVEFLFFLILCFFSNCEQQVKKSKELLKNTEFEILYKKSISKDLSFIDRLNLSKKILKFNQVNDSILYLVHNNISFLYSKLKRVDSSIYYTKKMLRSPYIKKNNKYKAKIYYKLGGYYNKKNQKDSVFYFYNKSKELYLEENDSIQIGRNLLNIAIIESDFGSYSTSDSTAVESIKFINGNRIKTTASAYNCLAINSTRRFLYKDAISYYETALKFSKNKNSQIKYINNIAIAYKELKNYSKSILILEKLLIDTIASKKTKARVIDNLAHIKWLQDPNKKILKDLLLAKSLKENEIDYFGLIASYSHLSDYFRGKNEKQSLFYANEMYRVAKKENATNGLLESIDKIVALQTPQKSIKYYKESIRLRDSLQETETKRQYKFANIKYNYEEEEKQKLKFKTLATESKLIAEQENNQKKNVLIITILSISGLLFFMYRRKQQHKKRILQENYNTETRIARRLHDELGNGIYNAIIKVQNPKFENEEIINDLDKIYLKTRAISHENDAIETGTEFENYFKDLVSSYNSVACKIILKDLSSLDLNNLNKDKQIVIYRVFNELFVNMKKHSKASLVVLSCKKKKNSLEIIYIDNGVGFKENTIVFKNGLKNMETRIKTINGTINFENKPDKGLKVSIHFKK